MRHNKSSICSESFYDVEFISAILETSISSVAKKLESSKSDDIKKYSSYYNFF